MDFMVAKDLFLESLHSCLGPCDRIWAAALQLKEWSAECEVSLTVRCSDPGTAGQRTTTTTLSTTRDGQTAFCTSTGWCLQAAVEEHDSITHHEHDSVTPSVAVWTSLQNLLESYNLCKVVLMLKRSLQSRLGCSVVWCDASGRPGALLCLPCSTQWDLRPWPSCDIDTGVKFARFTSCPICWKNPMVAMLSVIPN